MTLKGKRHKRVSLSELAPSRTSPCSTAPPLTRPCGNKSIDAVAALGIGKHVEPSGLVVVAAKYRIYHVGRSLHFNVGSLDSIAICGIGHPAARRKVHWYFRFCLRRLLIAVSRLRLPVVTVSPRIFRNRDGGLR
jgi:hypothetical protein